MQTARGRIHGRAETARRRVRAWAEPARGRKGQQAVFEQVLLFAVGVAIFLATFAVFTLSQNYYTQAGATDHLRQARELIAGELQAFAAFGNASNQSVTLAIPRDIDGEVYQIVLRQDGLNLTAGAFGSSFSNLGRLNESFNLSGVANSDNARLIITKTQGSIVIG